MKQVYLNNPKFTVSNIVISTDNDDLVVLAYLVNRLNYNGHKYSHHVHVYTGKEIQSSVNSANKYFQKETENVIDTLDFCTKIAVELNSYNEGLTSISRMVLGFYFESLYITELDEQLSMSETVTKLYAEWLMEYK